MNDTLFYILNSRYLAKRATLITTNFQDADREKVLAADPLRRKEYLVERIGQRLRSRLMEMCVVVAMDGPDRRRVRQDGHRQYVVLDALQSELRRTGGTAPATAPGSPSAASTRPGTCATPRSSAAPNASGFR